MLICNINLFNNAIEISNFSATLDNENLKMFKAQKISTKFVTPSIVYELINPISSKTFNVIFFL